MPRVPHLLRQAGQPRGLPRDGLQVPLHLRGRSHRRPLHGLHEQGVQRRDRLRPLPAGRARPRGLRRDQDDRAPRFLIASSASSGHTRETAPATSASIAASSTRRTTRPSRSGRSTCATRFPEPAMVGRPRQGRDLRALAAGSRWRSPAAAEPPASRPHRRRVADQLSQTDDALRSGDRRLAGRGRPALERAAPGRSSIRRRPSRPDARYLAEHSNLTAQVLPLLPGPLAGQVRRLTRAERDLLRLSHGARQRNLRVGAPAAALRPRLLLPGGAGRYGVGWNYLAAIHLVETKFGRVKSDSVAGAQGPMQFIPSTWRIYGNGGDIHDPHDAILAAARLLRANGAPQSYAACPARLQRLRPLRRRRDAATRARSPPTRTGSTTSTPGCLRFDPRVTRAERARSCCRPGP